jgi:hypothetical protein
MNMEFETRVIELKREHLEMKNGAPAGKHFDNSQVIYFPNQSLDLVHFRFCEFRRPLDSLIELT